MKQYILYLNLPDSYCQIFLPTENNRKYELELSASLDALEAQLGSRFVRTHRSYLVNQRHILSYDAGTMTVTLAAEQSGAGVRLLPFQTPQDCFAYLRESGYAREALQPSTGRQTAAFRTKRKKRFGRSGRKGHEQRENSDRDQCRRCEPVI